MPFDGTELQWEPPVTKVLRQGRQRIEDGWCQGSMRLYGGVCMVGALGDAAWALHASDAAYIDAVELLKKAAETPDIPRWNDVPGRTKEEVLAACDGAIALSLNP